MVVSKQIKSQRLAQLIKWEEDIFYEYWKKKIGEAKLKMSLENIGEWSGPVEQTDLYNLWLEATNN